MKVCILGATGLLGQALVKECGKRNYDVVTVARKNTDIELDITDEKQLLDYFNANVFDVVVNTVAIVNHKICDDNPHLAYMVNARPNAFLSDLSKIKKFKLVYISTDGYFYGDKDLKHDENAQVHFLNEYARTKFLGEQFTLTNSNNLVTRTNIVGFKNAQTPTFFEWALNAVKNKDEITLFEDYYTSSISVSQFAKSLFDLISIDSCGLFNLASSEVSSKKQFIEKMSEIFDLNLENAKTGSVNQLSSKRADSLGLNVTKAERTLGYKLPNLEEVLVQLKEEYDELRK